LGISTKLNPVALPEGSAGNSAGYSAGISPAIKRATLLPLIAITYCMVAGGPYGLEEAVGASGYFRTVLLLLITPLLWSFPVTLMVSELSAALPEDGGYYVWVRRAMGPFWGFQEAWLSLAASIFDMAVYPTLFITYLARLWPAAGEGWLSLGIGIGLIIVCVVINLLGIRPVGAGSLAMTITLLLPFAVVVVLALWCHPQAVAAATTQTAAQATPQFTWLGGLLVVMWNYMGWDNASTIAGEVDRPQRNYPLGMLLAVLLVAATYVIPVSAAAHTGIPAESWDTGSWVDVGRTLGNAASSHWGAQLGEMLAIAITAGGMISAFSTFNALILSYSRVPVAMAVDGFLPKFMTLRSRRTGVPWVAILLCALAWALCLKIGFTNLLLLDTTLYGLSLILEFAALIALRIREPDLPRPYKLPGGLAGCILITLGPTLILCLAFYESLYNDGAREALITSGISVAMGIGLYFLVVWINPRARGALAKIR
jgi:amino acid transporter